MMPCTLPAAEHATRRVAGRLPGLLEDVTVVIRDLVEQAKLERSGRGTAFTPTRARC